MARGSASRPQGSALHFDGEFDFETSNAQFDKVQIEKELKEKLTLGILTSDVRGIFQHYCDSVEMLGNELN